MSGKPAFGIYAPNENTGPRGQGPRPAVYTREGGEKLSMNPLYDFVFLNLEGSYDGAAIKAMAEGLRSAERRRPQGAHRPHPADRKGWRCRDYACARQGGVRCRRRRRDDSPHPQRRRSEAGDRFLPGREGERLVAVESQRRRIAMLMLEDPAAVAQAKEIADLEGLQHSRVRHRQPRAGAWRRSRRRRSGHAEGAGGSAARKTRRHAHVQRPGCREAREGRIPRAADTGTDRRRGDQGRPRRRGTIED